MAPHRRVVLTIAAAALTPVSLLAVGAVSAAGSTAAAPIESHDGVQRSGDHHDESGSMPMPAHGNGDHPGMTRMHEQMMAGNPGMSSMHDRMRGMSAAPGDSPT